MIRLACRPSTHLLTSDSLQIEPIVEHPLIDGSWPHSSTLPLEKYGYLVCIEHCSMFFVSPISVLWGAEQICGMVSKVQCKDEPIWLFLRSARTGASEHEYFKTKTEHDASGHELPNTCFLIPCIIVIDIIICWSSSWTIWLDVKLLKEVVKHMVPWISENCQNVGKRWKSGPADIFLSSFYTKFYLFQLI